MYIGHLSGYATVRITTSATDPDEPSTQTFTSITSDSAGQASTVVSIVVITAAPDSPTSSSTAAPTVGSANKDHTTVIIGGTLGGVAAGVIAAGLICYILYRRHKQGALNKNTGVSFPPNSPTNKPGFKHVADAELDTHPNMVVELPTSGDPGELDATPAASPNLNNRVSAMTTSDNARWSAVSPCPRGHPPSVQIALGTASHHPGVGE